MIRTILTITVMSVGISIAVGLVMVFLSNLTDTKAEYTTSECAAAYEQARSCIELERSRGR